MLWHALFLWQASFEVHRLLFSRAPEKNFSILKSVFLLTRVRWTKGMQKWQQRPVLQRSQTEQVRAFRAVQAFAEFLWISFASGCEHFFDAQIIWFFFYFRRERRIKILLGVFLLHCMPIIFLELHGELGRVLHSNQFYVIEERLSVYMIKTLIKHV